MPLPTALRVFRVRRMGLAACLSLSLCLACTASQRRPAEDVASSPPSAPPPQQPQAQPVRGEAEVGAAPSPAPVAPAARRAPEPRSVQDVMAQARADVLALGRAELSNIRELTSRAMYSMADLAEAVGGAGVPTRQLEEIRAEARRLHDDPSGPFARAGWVARGLQAALASLDQLGPRHAPLVAEWTRAARTAAADLPDRGALPFQHAAIQDAFRSTLDAFGAALLAREACEGGGSGHLSAAAGEPAPRR
jgi:hypothetical protein